ncbi:hypothetical protein L810_6704 [Burkholderia sp. AU4i]|nr:hypothetical protein L810_6704 [Burkholderia sp. AU4i]MDW9244333.1 hypothetical protein [Burkholderia cepacia]
MTREARRAGRHEFVGKRGRRPESRARDRNIVCGLRSAR